MKMNLFYMVLLVLFLISVSAYYFWDDIFKKIPYKNSIVITEKKSDCILVMTYATKYVFGRHGTNISVDDTHVANVKPGDTIQIPIKMGVRRISTYWHENDDKYGIEVCVDENTMLYVYAEFGGQFAIPSIKELKKNDSFNESDMENKFQKRLREVKSLKLVGLLKLCPLVIIILIIGTVIG